MIKNPPANTGDTGLIPGSGRSPGGGNGNLLHYSCLENLGTGEAGGLQSTGFQRARQLSDLSTHHKRLSLRPQHSVSLLREVIEL